MRGMGGAWARGGIVLGLLAAVAAVARADGCFFKDRRFPAPAPIPAQRALIVHRDGVERLVVESTLDAEGQAFGWVLPLPSTPTSVEVSTPGALDTLDLATRPRIVTRGSVIEILVPVGLIVVLAFALRLYGAGVRGDQPLGKSPAGAFVLVALLALLAAMISIPNLLAGRLGMPTVPGVRASDPQRVGNYEVTVLQARDATALGAWLEKSGLAPVPEAGRPIVDDYAARGWTFVAARLVREGKGPAAPHPLSVTFPSARPVYPMRLTALAGGTTDVRLHVVAGGAASCPPLEIRFSGAFREDEVDVSGFAGERGRMLVHGDPWEPRRVAHPSLRENLWDGCVVTRLEGSMASADMTRDLEFEVGGTETRVHVLHTPAAAWREALSSVAWFWAAAVLALVLVPDGRLPSLGARGSPFFRWVVVLAAAGGAATALIRMPLATIPESDLVSGGSPFRFAGVSARILREIDGYAGRSPAEARAVLESNFRAHGTTNPFTGKPVRWGDSPGDVLLLEDHRGLVLRTFSLEGAPVDRAWHVERLRGMLVESNARRPTGTLDEARRSVFPDGSMAGGVRSPFTGAPVREGRDPGDAEVAEKGGRLLLRAWFREGRNEDLEIR